MCLCDINGHIGDFGRMHGGYGVGQRIFEGRLLSQFCMEKEICVSNTWLKRDEKRKVTFRMDENETELTLC